MTPRRLALYTLLALALLLAAPVAAEEIWEKQLGAEITALATDETGDHIYAGTALGIIYCYDAAGDVQWSQQVITTSGSVPITEIVVSGDGTRLALTTGAAGKRTEVRNTSDGELIWERHDGGWSVQTIDISDTGDQIAQAYPGSNSVDVSTVPNPSILTRFSATNPTQVILAPSGAWLAYNSANTDLVLRALRDDIPGYSTYGPTYNNVLTAAYTGGGVQLITIHRSAGTPYTETVGSTTVWHLYVGTTGCKADYADIRFTGPDGADLTHYRRPGYTSSVGTFEVELPATGGPLTVWHGNPAASSASAGAPFFTPTSYTAVGSATYTVPSGVSAVEVLIVAGGGGGGQSFTYGGKGGGGGGGGGGGVVHTSISVTPGSAHSVVVGPGGSPDNKGGNSVFGSITAIGGGKGGQSSSGGGKAGGSGGSGGGGGGGKGSGAPGGAGTPGQGTAGEAGSSDATAPPGGAGGGLNYASDITGTSKTYGVGGSGGSGYAISGSGGSGYAPASGSTGGSGIVVVKPLPASNTLGTVTPIPLTLTKTYTGTITRLSRDVAGEWIAIQTDTRLYMQEITTPTAFGTTVDLGDRSGTPYDIAITDSGSFLIEGRATLADIFRVDGVQVGTYTAGNNVRHVAIAQKNGLYAAAGSDDGKYYLFSKDASSSWYLLKSSDSYDPITALAMSWRGEVLIAGRSGGLLTYFSTVEGIEHDGRIRATVYKDSIPYTGVTVRVENGGSNQAWGTPTTLKTDDYGVVSLPVTWGDYIRITVGDDEHSTILVATPTQAEYIIRIKSDIPLRTGAQYSSTYDDITKRIYLTYEDTRDKTHHVTYKITRVADNAVVFEQSYTDADLPLSTYYQIPAGWTNSSYRVYLKASGSPSFTNTWVQWVGTGGIADLPEELDKYARLGIAFFLILFVAGLFSYMTGPQGAVIVSLFAAALVLWGWLPLPPTLIALCIVWAFLGLLGRTGGE